jgi:hypothetical protein
LIDWHHYFAGELWPILGDGVNQAVDLAAVIRLPFSKNTLLRIFERSDERALAARRMPCPMAKPAAPR